MVSTRARRRPGCHAPPTLVILAASQGANTAKRMARLKIRWKKALLWTGAALIALAASGLLLADHLYPPASGTPSTVLPLQPDQTDLDRELAPVLARHPGETGVLLLSDGLDAFAARALSARKAGRSLDLQYYIWHDDLTGRLLGREAWRAAERGVRVRILLDDMNAKGMDSKLLLLDGHPNIEIRLYNPFRNRDGIGRVLELVQRGFSLNHRMHNKAWIADNRVAVVGGRNIGVEYFEAGKDVNFRDLDMLMFGPAVQQASTAFDAYWNSSAAVPLSTLADGRSADFGKLMRTIDAEAGGPAAEAYITRLESSRTFRDYAGERLTPFWTTRLRVVADPPVKWKGEPHDDWLVDHIARDIAAARHKALIISPYFVPGDSGTEAMTGLVKRGVQVGVVTNSLAANDVGMVYGAYSGYRPTLLAGGVQLYELRAQAAIDGSLFGSSGASLHTKAYSVDDRRGFIGSFNLDPRSAWLNTEMGVFFDDPALAVAVRNEYLRLAAPKVSYWMHLEGAGNVRWLDRAATPPGLLDTAPGTTLWGRASTRVISWLPIESQL